MHITNKVFICYLKNYLEPIRKPKRSITKQNESTCKIAVCNEQLLHVHTWIISEINLKRTVWNEQWQNTLLADDKAVLWVLWTKSTGGLRLAKCNDTNVRDPLTTKGKMFFGFLFDLGLTSASALYVIWRTGANSDERFVLETCSVVGGKSNCFGGCLCIF